MLQLTEIELEYLAYQDLPAILAVFDLIPYEKVSYFLSLSHLPPEFKEHLENLPLDPPFLTKQDVFELPDKIQHRLAYSRYTDPADLAILATSPSPGVRSAVAKNPHAPESVKSQLAKDSDPFVSSDALKELKAIQFRQSMKESRQTVTPPRSLIGIFSAHSS